MAARRGFKRDEGLCVVCRCDFPGDAGAALASDTQNAPSSRIVNDNRPIGGDCGEPPEPFQSIPTHPAIESVDPGADLSDNWQPVSVIATPRESLPSA